MIYAKPSTSLVVVFRAYLASDHVTPATGKTIAITISKNGGAFGNPNAGATNATEISSGFYKVTLDTTDTGTAGPLAVRGAVATVDDVGILYYVGQAPADVTHFGGSAGTFASGRPEVNTTHFAGTAATAAAGIPEVKVASIAANAITAASMAADAGAEIADAVWDEATAGHVTAGSTGVALTDILTDTGTTLDGRIPAALGANGSIKADVRDWLNSAVAPVSVNGVPEVDVTHVAGVTTDVATMPTSIAAILVDTGTTLDTNISAIKAKTDNLPAAPASTTNITAGTITTVTNLTNAPTAGDLTATMKASVNTEVLDVLNVDTFAEPVGAPAATSTLRAKIGWIFKLLRNKRTQTSTTETLYADDATTADATSTKSDDGTTATRGEWTA